jgi:hypothetical protein
MHTSTLKLIYIHSGLLHVSTKHVAIFRNVKYRGWVDHVFASSLWWYLLLNETEGSIKFNRIICLLTASLISNGRSLRQMLRYSVTVTHCTKYYCGTATEDGVTEILTAYDHESRTHWHKKLFCVWYCPPTGLFMKIIAFWNMISYLLVI